MDIQKDARAPGLVLHEQPGYGSALIEAQLALYQLDYTLRPAGEILENEDARARMARINPVGQLPVLELPNGAVMTESAAITLWLGETYGAKDRALVPEIGAAERAPFLRWLIFWVASPYSVFTYMDRSAEYVDEPKARARFEAALRARLSRLLMILEHNAAGPWYLGDHFSALDIYAAVFREWTLGPQWYAEHAPVLTDIARRAWDIDALKPVYARNFPDGG